MEKEEIFKKVQALIVDSQGLSPNEVSLDANFKEDLQIDSLELIVYIGLDGKIIHFLVDDRHSDYSFTCFE